MQAAVPQPEFSADDQKTWTQLYDRLDDCRRNLAHPLFAQGIDILGLSAERIPELAPINKILLPLTGWQGFVADGFVKAEHFFAHLKARRFPVGNFLRAAKNLNYTPAPDIFHDLYGHLPFFTDPDFSDFCQRFGVSAEKYADTPDKIDQYDRLFWFGVEFPLIKYNAEKRIFGGGILSSYRESYYSLGTEPEVRPFNLEVIRNHAFYIDKLQNILYLLENKHQLYDCLPAFEKLVRQN